MNVYCFNPDNDLALANGGSHYTPTPMAAQLRRDLQLLPGWIAGSGDCVLCDSHEWQGWLTAATGTAVNIITRRDLPHLCGDVTFMPWGWSPAMRWRLLRDGVNEALLPTEEQITTWRQLSHRRTTIALHQAISRHAGKQFCPAPVELSDINGILQFARMHPGCYAKEPWSGSGRGVYRAIRPDGQDFIQRCQGALNRQGSMLCEQSFERVMDFAVEIQCKQAKAQVIGYSIFESDFHLQYKRGIVDSMHNLRHTITSQYPDFHSVESALVKALDDIIAPYYQGYLGVDMLLFDCDDGSTGINPCVELNLRTTMGTVTAALSRTGKGSFSIAPVQAVNATHVMLTPITPETKFTAIITPS